MESIQQKQERMSTLRKNLPRGAMKLISERTGVHRDTVARVLNGRSYREDVIKEALKIINDFHVLMNEIEKVME